MDKTQDILGVLILYRATKGYRKLKFDSIDIAEGEFLELRQESSQKLPPKPKSA